jgi:hypothetical protein
MRATTFASHHWLDGHIVPQPAALQVCPGAKLRRRCASNNTGPSTRRRMSPAWGRYAGGEEADERRRSSRAALAPSLPHAPVPSPARPQPHTPPPAGAASTTRCASRPLDAAQAASTEQRNGKTVISDSVIQWSVVQ